MKNRLKTGAINTEDLLKRVSRSFYITLRILPRSIRPQLSLAYLLARATDTVADTGAITAEKRRQVLSELRMSIQAVCAGEKVSAPDLSVFLRADRPEFSSKKDEAELTLLKNFETLLRAMPEFSNADRKKICAVLETITHGQQTDIHRFGAASERLTALATDDELDIYTYEVAGCVGEFWTLLCLAHVFPRVSSANQLMSDAVRFGKGLQLVNILRDIPEDLQQGRCYIPEQSLSRFGLTPEDLLNPDVMQRFRPLYDGYLEFAEEHLRAGWRYTTSLPFRCVRIRLACAWPILIAIKTLRRLRCVNVLGDSRVKVARREIRRILVKSVFLYPRRKAWNRLFDAL
jgi:farnesyl-diphosphate farnesyltransferase